MMNRSVMQRQMFAKGGAAFPDLSGDGQITQKDILMGRGVIPMQEGGMAPMMPPQGAAPMMPPSAAMMGQASGVPEEQAEAMGAQVMDTGAMQGMLAQVADNLENLDEVEDYEQVMNVIRGDNATLEDRYDELSGVVGPEDARQTPESVLALVQPVMMMAAVDQGIGGLAAEEMTAPVEGAMAEGIMSTVAPPPPAEMAPSMPPARMGGPPPVNFNQGGLVRRGDNQPVIKMQEGGDPIAAAGRLGELYQQKVPLYKSILGDQSAAIEEQKKLTQAQMLFDLANTAVAFAGPMEGERRGMSPAERLAMAAQKTQLLPTISARSAEQLKAKQAADAKTQQMKLSALSAAETGLAAEQKAKADAALQAQEDAAALARMDRKAVLDLNLQSTLEGLKQAGRIEIKEIEGAQSMSLEELKQKGAINLEDYRQVNRVALENVVQNNRKDIETLKASGRQSDLVLANELEQENIVLRGNIKLSQMGVANEYELERLGLTQGFERELNSTNNALKEKLSGLDRELNERRLRLETIKAEVARAQGQEKIDLQRQAQEMQAEMNAFEQSYKTEKLDIEKAAARLTRLGTNTNARITTLISDPESLAKYAAGTMTPEETLEFNQAIAYYNAPKSVWNEEKKGFVIVPGNPLSNELMSSIRIRQESGLTVPNIKLDATTTEKKPETKEEVVSSIMSGIEDPTAAFGTEGAAKSVFNTLAEVFFFNAPFKAEKEAIAGAEALNTKFVQVFQRSAELRDSVMQLNLLKDLTPTPSSMFTGPDAAGAKITRLLGMIDEAETALNTKLNDPDSPLTSKQVTEARGYLTDLAQLRAGYNVFDRAYKQTTASQDKVDALRTTLGLGNRN
jgi:hypothetical protein